MVHKIAAAILLLPLALCAQEAPETQEWEAKLVAPSNPDRSLTFRILARRTDSTWDAVLQQVDPAGMELKVQSFAIFGEIVRFEIQDGVIASFTGKLNGAKDEVVGTWNQGQRDYPLTLKRIQSTRLLESWKATRPGDPNPVEVQFRIMQTESGKQIARFDSLTEKLMGLKAGAVLQDKKIVFEVAVLNARFEGTVNAAGNAAVGIWKEGAAEYAVTFERTVNKATAVEPEPPPPLRSQTPTPPFRYTIEEVTFKNNVDDVTLAGTLTRPTDDKKHAAVVLISGSGPQDRDQTIFRHKPFMVIADDLTKAGFAVLRFDDRGVGSSTGNHDTATTVDFAQDVLAAIRFLQNHEAIDTSKIGLIGHSEGGLIAPMVAADNPEVAFIVLMAGPGVNGFEILREQGPRIAAAEGLPAEAFAVENGLNEAVALAIRDSPESADARLAVDRAIDRYVSGFPLSDQATVRPSAEQAAASRALATPWFQFFLRYEPASSLRRVSCPVLAINGERDVQVWHETNLQAIATALKTGGNTNFRAVRFPALNHLFQRAQTGSESEYGQIESTIASEVLTLLRSWIGSTTKSKR